MLGFPNFFAPNKDREKDRWYLRGIDQTVFPESSIYIYDRYEKLLSIFDANDRGWDRTVGNIPSISTDYWYIVELKDVSGGKLIYKGHFSLVRR